MYIHVYIHMVLSENVVHPSNDSHVRGTMMIDRIDLGAPTFSVHKSGNDQTRDKHSTDTGCLRMNGPLIEI